MTTESSQTIKLNKGDEPGAQDPEKKAQLQLGSGEMFDQIAHRYDLLNRLLSLGVDQGWRKQTVQAMNLEEKKRALDLATGTADLAIQISKSYPELEVIGVDPSSQMLQVGEQKIEDQKLSNRVELEKGDAQSLIFDDDSFDACSIAFGIRNVPDRVKALREMARVVKPKGRVCILELSEPRRGIMGPLARFYVHHFVPWLGSLLSGSKEYRYLQQSIAAFPPAKEFGKIMESAGLRVLEIRPLTFGVCHLYIAEVI